MCQSQSPDDAFLHSLAEAITRRGLRTLALAILEAGQPLTLLAGQVVWFAQPALGLVWERNDVAQLARLLERPERINVLIAHLEAG